MSKQSSVLANVGVLLGAMVLGISVGMADTTKSGSSMPMGEKMEMQDKMGMEKETGITEEKMGVEKTESMTEKGHMKMDKDQMKGAMPMGDTKR